MRNTLASFIIMMMLMAMVFAMFNNAYTQPHQLSAEGLQQQTTATPEVVEQRFVAGKGAQIFQYDDAVFDVYGNCAGEDCELVARFTSDDLIRCFELGFALHGTAEPMQPTATPTLAPISDFTCDFVTYDVPLNANQTLEPNSTLEPTLPAATPEIITFEGLRIAEREQNPPVTPTNAPGATVTATPYWYVVVFHLGMNSNNDSHIFQINIYDQANQLQDDSTLLRVRPDGTTTMFSNQPDATETPQG